MYVGPTLTVVMKHIKGRTVDEAPVLPKNTCNGPRKRLINYDAQTVFGDLGAPKIMLSGARYSSSVLTGQGG